MLQEIAIILIGILTAGYVVWKLYRRFTTTSSSTNSPCAGCGGCGQPDTRNETCPPESKKRGERSK
ncbi:MAG: hypothetical protein LBP98_10630 [Tannerella sp.]|jgi:hypothetical protein|nr:hypothetical protein [Tannerella sp.]